MKSTRSLRRGLDMLHDPPPGRSPYRITTRNLGRARIRLDSIAEALAVAEGEG